MNIQRNQNSTLSNKLFLITILLLNIHIISCQFCQEVGQEQSNYQNIKYDCVIKEGNVQGVEFIGVLQENNVYIEDQIYTIKLTIDESMYGSYFDFTNLVIQLEIEGLVYNQDKQIGLVVTKQPFDNESDFSSYARSYEWDVDPVKIDITGYYGKKDKLYYKVPLFEIIADEYLTGSEAVIFIQFINSSYSQYNESYTAKFEVVLADEFNRNTPCPHDCSESFGICLEDGSCQCSVNYFDIDCSLKADKVYPDAIQAKAIGPKAWKYYYFPVNYDMHSIYLETQTDSNSIYLHQFLYMENSNTYTRPVQAGAQKLSKAYLFGQNNRIQNYIRNTSLKGLEKKQQAILIGIQNQGNISTQVKLKFTVNVAKEEQKQNNTEYIYLILILVAIIIFLSTIIFYCRFRNNKGTPVPQQQRQMSRDQLERQRRLQAHFKKEKFQAKYKKLVEKLMPKNTFEKYCQDYPSLEQQSECIVCLVGFEKNDDCRFTLCGHLFHLTCFEQWVLKHFNCPFCREDYNPKPLMKIYYSKKEGTFDKLTDQEKKENSFVHRMKQKSLKPMGSQNEFDDLLVSGRKATTVAPTQAEGTEIPENAEFENENQEEQSIHTQTQIQEGQQTNQRISENSHLGSSVRRRRGQNNSYQYNLQEQGMIQRVISQNSQSNQENIDQEQLQQNNPFILSEQQQKNIDIISNGGVMNINGELEEQKQNQMSSSNISGRFPSLSSPIKNINLSSQNISSQKQINIDQKSYNISENDSGIYLNPGKNEGRLAQYSNQNGLNLNIQKVSNEEQKHYTSQFDDQEEQKIQYESSPVSTQFMKKQNQLSRFSSKPPLSGNIADGKTPQYQKVNTDQIDSMRQNNENNTQREQEQMNQEEEKLQLTQKADQQQQQQESYRENS